MYSAVGGGEKQVDPVERRCSRHQQAVFQFRIPGRVPALGLEQRGVVGSLDGVTDGGGVASVEPLVGSPHLSQTVGVARATGVDPVDGDALIVRSCDHHARSVGEPAVVGHREGGSERPCRGVSVAGVGRRGGVRIAEVPGMADDGPVQVKAAAAGKLHGKRGTAIGRCR